MSKYPWQGRAARIDDYDLPRIGHKIGVGEDPIHMILDVESRGTGFNANGVILLFEEHVFYRCLPKNKQDQAVALGLAWPKWRKNYKSNYSRFLKAYAFHPSAALKACSWGLGQVLGENHLMLGYGTPREMVEAFADDEANQLEGMIDFIIKAGLADEMRALEKEKDRGKMLGLAAKIARTYNGPGYKTHRYDERLVERLIYWRSKPDTPWSPVIAAAESIVAGDEPVTEDLPAEEPDVVDVPVERPDPKPSRDGGFLSWLGKLLTLILGRN